MGAQIFVKQELGRKALTFRIVTPGTFQVTAFKEYSGADAGTVYQRGMGNVKNLSGHLPITVRSRMSCCKGADRVTKEAE